MEQQQKPPQLIWDRGVPIWRATRAAKKAGYPVKRVNLSYFAADEAALFERCRLTAEQNEWLSPQRADPLFDGTIRTVINLWQTDPAVPYDALEASSRHPYDAYAACSVEVGRVALMRSMVAMLGVGTRLERARNGGRRPRIAAARMAIMVLKTRYFVAGCRLPGCNEFARHPRGYRFPGTAPRARKRRPRRRSLRPRAGGARVRSCTRQLRLRVSIRGRRCGSGTLSANGCRFTDQRPSLPSLMAAEVDRARRGRRSMNTTLPPTRRRRRRTAPGAEVVFDLKALPMVMEEIATLPVRGPTRATDCKSAYRPALSP